MSFIDYNFFPILFFLGWNILTTKQLKPITYQTSNFKTWSTLPVFPLTNQTEQKFKAKTPRNQVSGPVSHPSDHAALVSLAAKDETQKILQANSKHEKDHSVLEFVPGFRFLSKNKKLSEKISRIGSKAQGNKRLHAKTETLELKTGIYQTFRPGSKFSSHPNLRNERLRFGIKKKPTEWLNVLLVNEGRTSYFTNYNLINNNWKENYKKSLFDFSYRLNQNRFISSFFGGPSNKFEGQTEDFGSSEIKFWHDSVFSDRNRFTHSASGAKIYGKGLEAASYEGCNPKEFKNDVFFEGLGFQNHDFFWQRVQKKLNHSWFFNDTSYMSEGSKKKKQSNWFLTLFGLKNQTKDAFKSFSSSQNAPKPCFEAHHPKSGRYGSDFSLGPFSVWPSSRDQVPRRGTTKGDKMCEAIHRNPTNKAIKKNHDFFSIFKGSSFFTIKTNQKEAFKINWIQKKRSKIRLALRIPVQKIYSLNKFQIALASSTISSSKGSKYFDFSLTPKEGFIKDKFKSSEFFDTRFLEQNTSYGFKSKKKDGFSGTFSKTGFFQHIAWNMKHKNLEFFFNSEYSLNSTNLSRYQEGIRVFSQNGTKKQGSSLKLLTMYGGSWYYENALFPIFSALVRTPLQLELTKHFRSNSTLKKSLEFDIGIYSLAHKLSSVGFRNSHASIDIYPFKYNDSYRYNFQNMTLSNHRLKNFLTSMNSQKKNVSPFLDFQNPTFSKTYAPLFQPQGLNLLGFLYNSFLNVIPTKSNMHISSQNQIQPIIEDNSYRLTDSKKINKLVQNMPTINGEIVHTPRRLKTFADIYHKLPINGIHANPYPWITQNAYDRWSNSKRIASSLFDPWFSFPERKPNDSGSASSCEGWNPKESEKQSVLITPLNKSDEKAFSFGSSPSHEVAGDQFDALAFQKNTLKNSNSYFRQKPSLRCVKKPSIFFSSFRNLPYFFISETFSVWPSNNFEGPPKNEILPQTNLFLTGFDNYQLEKPSKNSFSDLSMPEYYLFQNNMLKQNQKPEPWKGYLQATARSWQWPKRATAKWFNLKPLSTFIKKELGYETSLFSVWPTNKFEGQTEKGSPATPYEKEDHRHWSKKQRKALQKTSIKKNTWKVFPPLFQSLSFRFKFLNLPRTWSSELIGFNDFEMLPVKKKAPSRSWSRVFSHKSIRPKVKAPAKTDILFKTKNWSMTQKKFFDFSMPFYFLDFFRFSNPVLNSEDKIQNSENMRFSESAFPLTQTSKEALVFDPRKVFKEFEYKQTENNGQANDQSTILSIFVSDMTPNSRQRLHAKAGTQKFEKKNYKSLFNETPESQNSKIIVYAEKPLLKTRTAHGPPLKNQKESISLPNYLKNITNQNYQNLCPNNINELYFVFWILFNKTLFIYLSLHYLRKFISFLGTEYIRNLFKIFVTMKFIDGNILSIIKTFQDFNFQLNQQNIIDIKVDKQLKNIKRD